MYVVELFIWSSMLGGLLTLAFAAMADVAIHRSASSLRSLGFLIVSGTSFVLLSGLPEDLFEDLSIRTMMTLKAGLTPLSGAMALAYMGEWLGESAEDRAVHYTIVWGSTFLVLSAVILAALSSFASQDIMMEILLCAFAVNSFSVLLATAMALRAAHLGDQLGREMVVACLFLTIAVAGLNGHQLFHETTGPLVWAATALSTILFFLILVNVGIRHGRRNRKLERLSGMSLHSDPATGLPQGSVLLSKVDDAFWRSARLNTQCTVICLHLRNLYELSETVGHSVDVQILTSMTARLRRAVGFRCVVGLYHPRCFVIVLSAVKQARVSDQLADRLRMLMAKPLNVHGSHTGSHVFRPRFSIGLKTVDPQASQPAAVIDEVEHLALAQFAETAETAEAAESAKSAASASEPSGAA